MGSRLQLQTLLETSLGSTNVYYQPPETVKLLYPCIIYSRSSVFTQFANDNPYRLKTRYQVKVLDKNPDSIIPAKIAMLPMCSFDRSYKADNLNHDVYNLYY